MTSSPSHAPTCCASLKCLNHKNMELPQDIKEYLESVRTVTPGELEILRIAVEALEDLGACDDEECDCDKCLRALPILKKTMRDIGTKMGTPVQGSGIGSEVGLATDRSRLSSHNNQDR